MFCRVALVNRLVGLADQSERVGVLIELLVLAGGVVIFLGEVRRDDVVVVVDRRVEEFDDLDKLLVPEFAVPTFLVPVLLILELTALLLLAADCRILEELERLPDELVLEPKALLRLELLLVETDWEEVDLPAEVLEERLTDCRDELLDLLVEVTDLLAERADCTILEDLLCREELLAELEGRDDFETADLLWLEELFDADARLAADTRLCREAAAGLMSNRPNAIPARISLFRN